MRVLPYRPLHAKRSRFQRKVTAATKRIGSRLPVRTLSSALSVLAGRAFPLLGMLVTGVLVARSVGPSIYGRYSAAYAIGALSVSGVTAGLPLLILRRSSQSDLDKGVLRRAIRIQLAFSSPVMLLCVIVGYGILGGVGGAAAAGAAGLAWVAASFSSIGQFVHAGQRRYKRTAATDIVTGVMYPVLTALALHLHAGITGALLAICAGNALSCLVAWTDIQLPETSPSSPLRVTDGLAFAALGTINAAYARADAAILILVAGGVQTGYYSAAYRIIGPFALLGSAFVTVYFSRLSEATTDRQLWNRIRRMGSGLFAAVAVAAAAGLWLVAPKLISLLYGGRYSQALGPARILLVSVIPWALYYPKSSELNSLGLERRTSLALSIGLILDLGLVALTGSRWGASAAAWAWVASEGAMLVGLNLLSPRSRRVRRSIRQGLD